MPKHKSDHAPIDCKSVGSAINSARSCYVEHQNACHPFIEALEDWVNSNPNAQPDDVQMNMDLGHLRKSPSSGRLFIQLRRY